MNIYLNHFFTKIHFLALKNEYWFDFFGNYSLSGYKIRKHADIYICIQLINATMAI